MNLVNILAHHLTYVNIVVIAKSLRAVSGFGPRQAHDAGPADVNSQPAAHPCPDKEDLKWIKTGRFSGSQLRDERLEAHAPFGPKATTPAGIRLFIGNIDNEGPHGNGCPANADSILNGLASHPDRIDDTGGL